MANVIRIGAYYYFNKRVPEEVRAFDPRKVVRLSLKTDSKTVAQRKALFYSEHLNGYWQDLLSRNAVHEPCRFKQIVRIARQMGFAYQPMPVVAALPVQQLIDRLLLLDGAKPIQIEAALGAKAAPSITVQDGLELFWTLTADKLVNKSENQVRKWRNPRKKAVANFIAVVGNKEFKDITRSDILSFRDWWLDRIKTGLNEDSANKNIVQLKSIFETVSDHEKLGLDIAHLFKKMILKVQFKQTRKPFTPDQIRAILHSPKLEGMSRANRWFLHALSETGARPSEIAGLLPEDIHLNVPIPYISIKGRKGRSLKTPSSEREIPLVGYSLDAFRAMPHGFPPARENVDSVTAAINKFLRENDLLPTKNHTVYSCRHGFQDRILSVNAPDRIQAELMGHKFDRPMYGDGGTLLHKSQWLEQICLKNN